MVGPGDPEHERLPAAIADAGRRLARNQPGYQAGVFDLYPVGFGVHVLHGAAMGAGQKIAFYGYAFPGILDGLTVRGEDFEEDPVQVDPPAVFKFDLHHAGRGMVNEVAHRNDGDRRWFDFAMKRAVETGFSDQVSHNCTPYGFVACGLHFLFKISPLKIFVIQKSSGICFSLSS
jgi:hypothetical protein